MEIISRKNIYSGFLKFDVLKVKFDNGNTIERDVIIKKDGVAIVAVTKNNEIYLTKQPRVAINEEESIEIPAGLIEENETIEETTKRELLEETGCISNKLIDLGFFYGDVGSGTNKTHLMLALDVEKVQELKLDEDEFLESYKLPKDKVYEMLDNGVIKDSHSIIGLLKAKKYIEN